MKFCQECGHRLDVNTSKFCPECGGGLGGSASLSNGDSALDLVAAVDPQSLEGVEMFNAGLAAAKAENFERASRLLQPLAMADDPVAIELLGHCLADSGRHDAALHWLSLGAARGRFDAVQSVGTRLYAQGNYDLARQYLSLSAEKGNTEDQSIMAAMCFELRDYDWAEHWWTRIVAESNPSCRALVQEAQANLVYMVQDPEYVAHRLRKRRVIPLELPGQ